MRQSLQPLLTIVFLGLVLGNLNLKQRPLAWAFVPTTLLPPCAPGAATSRNLFQQRTQQGIIPCIIQTKRFLSNVDMSDVESARKLFYLWFFGGSGGGGIAIAAFPEMYKRFMDMRSLGSSSSSSSNKAAGLGTATEKEETIGISPLCLYPEDLKLKDVQKILNNPMSVEKMVKLGPKESFWAERGYLRYEAFKAANRDCNPLAVRAVFDAFTTSTSTVEPDIAQNLLDSFREDLALFKNTLLWNKVKGYSAIALLVFLLGLAASVSLESLAAGWFPDWPGRYNFPLGLVDPGFWTIPDYWI
jgi:hypothetical protein